MPVQMSTDFTRGSDSHSIWNQGKKSKRGDADQAAMRIMQFMASMGEIADETLDFGTFIHPEGRDDVTQLIVRYVFRCGSYLDVYVNNYQRAR